MVGEDGSVLTSQVEIINALASCFEKVFVYDGGDYICDDECCDNVKSCGLSGLISNFVKLFETILANNFLI